MAVGPGVDRRWATGRAPGGGAGGIGGRRRPRRARSTATSIGLVGPRAARTESAGRRRPACRARRGHRADRRVRGLGLQGDAASWPGAADGQVIQLTALLYLVAEACDGDARRARDRRERERAVRAPGQRRQRAVPRRGASCARSACSPPPTARARAAQSRSRCSALRSAPPLVPERGVAGVAPSSRGSSCRRSSCSPCSRSAAFDVWLFFSHGIGGGLRTRALRPGAPARASSAASSPPPPSTSSATRARAATAARGRRLGAGIYLVWPAFYCDVTDAYRLDQRRAAAHGPRRRLLQRLFALVCGGPIRSRARAAHPRCVMQHMPVLQQLLPLLRFDGYYVLTDLTGVPDILSRHEADPALPVPGRGASPRVEALKPWVRAGFRVRARARARLRRAARAARHRRAADVRHGLGLIRPADRRVGDAAASDASSLSVAGGGLQVLALVLPVAGIASRPSRLGRRLGGGVVGWARGTRLRSAVASAATLVTGRPGRAPLVAQRRLRAAASRRAVTLAGADDALAGGPQRPAVVHPVERRRRAAPSPR